jgi:hypothetical protein
LQHATQSQQVAITSLAIGCCKQILNVRISSLLEVVALLLILKEFVKDLLHPSILLTIKVLSVNDSVNNLLADVQDRIVSVRPCKNWRVDADS